MQQIEYMIVPLTSVGRSPRFFTDSKRWSANVLMPNTVETKIEEVLESIRPALKADGGDVEFLRFNEEDGVVELRLLGACEDCPISMMTLKDGIEQRLKSGIPGVTEVRAV